MPNAVRQSITGSSDAVGTVLFLCCCDGGVKVVNHRSAQSASTSEGHAAAAAATERLPLAILVGVTNDADCLCHGGVVGNEGIVARNGAGHEPHPTNGSIERRRRHSVGTRLSVLPRDDGGRHAPVNVGGRAPVAVFGVVGSADPHGLAIAEAGCHGEREAGHGRFGWELREL